MAKTFPRIQATDEADLPHRYEGRDRLCGLCQSGVNDARHEAWTRMELARETATREEDFRTFG